MATRIRVTCDAHGRVFDRPYSFWNLVAAFNATRSHNGHEGDSTLRFYDPDDGNIVG